VAIESAEVKTVLAIDTASPRLSLAIARGHHLLAMLGAEDRTPHSEILFHRIDQLLRITGLQLEQVDAFAAVNGPGSFTGLRVGIAAVEGLARARGKPGIGIGTLDALSLSAGVAARIIAFVRAGRHEICGGCREVEPDGQIARVGQDLCGPPAAVLAEAMQRGSAQPPILIGEDAPAIGESIAELAGTEVRKVRMIERGAEGWQWRADHPSLAPAAALLAARRAGERAGGEAWIKLRADYLRPVEAQIRRGEA
jgi:tRNA threonylcarbamoyladenosine biosynthesis protein TsaB